MAMTRADYNKLADHLSDGMLAAILRLESQVVDGGEANPDKMLAVLLAIEYGVLDMVMQTLCAQVTHGLSVSYANFKSDKFRSRLHYPISAQERTYDRLQAKLAGGGK